MTPPLPVAFAAGVLVGLLGNRHRLTKAPEPPEWMNQSGYRPPVRWEDALEQPWVHAPCGTPISVDDDGGQWCPLCGTYVDSQRTEAGL